jgi:hypothetical protein
MKKIVLIMLMFIGMINLTVAQNKLLEILPINQKSIVSYTEVINIDSTNKEILYNRAKRWVVDNYKSGKDVIQLDDKENFEIIGKGFHSETWQVTFYAFQDINIWHTIKIITKDNKYKYEITDFRVVYYVKSTQYTSSSNIDLPLEEWNKNRDKNNQRIYLKIDENIKLMIKSLKEAMNTNVNNEW